MDLKDCKVTLMLNMHTGYSANTVQEDILQDILKIACPNRVVSWEYHEEFISGLEKLGFDLKACKFIPNFYVKVVGGYGTCFTVTNIYDLFSECFTHGIKINI